MAIYEYQCNQHGVRVIRRRMEDRDNPVPTTFIGMDKGSAILCGSDQGCEYERLLPRTARPVVRGGTPVHHS